MLTLIDENYDVFFSFVNIDTIGIDEDILTITRNGTVFELDGSGTEGDIADIIDEVCDGNDVDIMVDEDGVILDAWIYCDEEDEELDLDELEAELEEIEETEQDLIQQLVEEYNQISIIIEDILA